MPKKLKSKVSFPYSMFHFRLEYKDMGDNKICWFQAYEHMAQHIDRYKIDTKNCKIDVRPGFKFDSKSIVKNTVDKKKKKLFSSLESFFNG